MIWITTNMGEGWSWPGVCKMLRTTDYGLSTEMVAKGRNGVYFAL